MISAVMEPASPSLNGVTVYQLFDKNTRAGGRAREQQKEVRQRLKRHNLREIVGTWKEEIQLLSVAPPNGEGAIAGVPRLSGQIGYQDRFARRTAPLRGEKP
jgi:hypothetical protein